MKQELDKQNKELTLKSEKFLSKISELQSDNEILTQINLDFEVKNDNLSKKVEELNVKLK